MLGAVFVVEIGDISRFTRPEQLTCWAGLTPRHYESDNTVRRTDISKEGCTLVRGKPARNIAKVAAARTMLEVVFYVLRDGHARCLTTPATPAAASTVAA